MFGYVKPRACELLVKEYELYKSAYCGICIEGGREVSRLTRFLLNDDFVFLCLLRMAVTGVKPETAKKRCPFHVAKRNVLVKNECVTYSCAAFAILTFEKFIDDVKDSKGLKRFAKRLALPYLKLMKRRAEKLYPSLTAIASKHLARLSALEADGNCTVDESAEPFASLVADFCAEGTDGTPHRILHECGYHLGRYIYLIDAFEDCIDDEKNGEYNCLNAEFGSAAKTVAAADTVHLTLRDSMTALCRAFALCEECGYGNLIYNIARLGSEDAFERAERKLSE